MLQHHTTEAMNELMLKIGIGGIVGQQLITFDFVGEDKLRPYVSKIIGRDFNYGFKREFAKKDYTKITKNFYNDRPMQMIMFELEKNVAYEYKRFPGNSFGEIEEGYFVILIDKIVEFEYDELMHYCSTSRERKARAKRLEKHKFEQAEMKFAKDDIDF